MTATTNTESAVNAGLGEETIRDLVEIIHFATAARDAMTDEMVGRIAGTASEGVMLLDRVLRNQGVVALLEVLNRVETQFLLISLADALGRMSRELATARPAKGGILELLRLAKQPGTQEGIRALSLLGQYWNESLRELHRYGGKRRPTGD